MPPIDDKKEADKENSPARRVAFLAISLHKALREEAKDDSRDINEFLSGGAESPQMNACIIAAGSMYNALIMRETTEKLIEAMPNILSNYRADE